MRLSYSGQREASRYQPSMGEEQKERQFFRSPISMACPLPMPEQRMMSKCQLRRSEVWAILTGLLELRTTSLYPDLQP